jgi:hypothetical protein
MTEELNRFGMGARFVPRQSLTENDLGRLTQLVGEWESVVLTTADKQGASQTIPSGWNVISVPGPTGFVFEVIPYKENLKFSTVAVQAGNRGPVLDGNPFDQQIFGLFYEQQIVSACDTDFCNQRGFGKDTVIHAETGLLLYVTNYNGGYDIARLGTVPHGNALLALGKSSEQTNPGKPTFPPLSAEGTNLDGSEPRMFGYNDLIIGKRQFVDFPQATPNAFLEFSLDSIVGSGSITNMITLSMSTNHPDATGGILNIPFIQTNVTATLMQATFWLENISGGSETDVLQYSQIINLVFPPVGSVKPIIWPHITVNTLKRMPKTETLKEMSTSSQGVPQL